MGVNTLPQAAQDIITVQVWNNDTVIDHLWAFVKSRVANADALLPPYLAAQVSLNSHIEVPGSAEELPIAAIEIGLEEEYLFPLPPEPPEIDYEVAPDYVDQPPTTAAYYGTTSLNTPLVIQHSSLLAGASDPEGEVPYVSAVKNAVNCAVVNDPAGATVSFSPNSGYSGIATFVFTVADGQGNFTDETATVQVG